MSEYLYDRVFATGYSAQAKAIDDNGSTSSDAWSITSVFTADVHDVAMNRQGDLYFVNSNKIYKYRQTASGYEYVWTYTFTEADLMRNISVDWQGYIYSASYSTNYVIKLSEDIDGNPQREWTYNWTGSVGAVDLAVDQDGYVVIGEHTAGNVRLIDPDGSLVWAYDGGGTWIRAVAFDTDGDVYALWEAGHFRKIRRSTGAQVWDYTGFSGEPMYALTVSKDKTFYLIGDTGTLYYMAEPSVDTTPTVTWSTDISGSWTNFDGLGHKVAVKPDNSEWYVAMYGEVAGVYKMHEVNGSPETIWENHNFTDHVRSVRIFPGLLCISPAEYGLKGKAATILKDGVVKLSGGVRQIL